MPVSLQTVTLTTVLCNTIMLFSNLILTVGSYSDGVSLGACCAVIKGDGYGTGVYVVITFL